MRPLTDDEMRVFFEKLQAFIGPNIARLIDRPDAPHTFRLLKDRVYYVSEAQVCTRTHGTIALYIERHRIQHIYLRMIVGALSA